MALQSVDLTTMIDREPNLDTQLIELESKVAFQEDTIDKLNQVVTAQQRRLDLLEKRLAELKTWMTAQQPSLMATAAEETPPPHY